MIPAPGTPASKQLQEIAGWGKATAVLNRLQARLTDHEIPTESLRKDGQPYLLVGGKVLVWTDHTAEDFYWGTEPGSAAKSAPSSDVPDVARRIAAQVPPASRPVEGEGSDVVTAA
ncbi:hypothetical protein [Streptosporangium sandarakinum]|uniref:hypothetical protein n=1 Tax=Streptosporangium sandarakinum TaxID=1260955 RepID=UPI00368B4EDB